MLRREHSFPDVLAWFALLTRSLYAVTLLASFLITNLQPSAAAAPINDSFADRTELPASVSEWPGTTVDATSEPGEPFHRYATGAKSVWYSWTALSSGYVSVVAIGTYVALEVYTGYDISNLTRVAYAPLDHSVSFLAEAGTTYQIAVVSNGRSTLTGFGESGSPFTLSVSPADVVIVWPSPGEVFSGPTNITLQIYLNPSNALPRRVEFYERTNLLGIATPPYVAFVWTNAQAGDYSIKAQAVAQDGTISASGSVPLVVYPSNDVFTAGTAIVGVEATVSGSFTHAATEAGEPQYADVSWGRTCWWSWTAPANGTVKLRATSPDFSPFINVYTGSKLTDLTRVASNSFLHCSESCGCSWAFLGDLNFRVIAGEVYRLQIDEVQTFSGGAFVGTDKFPHPPDDVPPSMATFHLAFHEPPGNDAFEYRTHLRGPSVQIRGSTLGATTQLGEPAHGGDQAGNSIWYSWKAPYSGVVSISTNSPDVESPPYDSSGDGATWSFIYDPVSCGAEYNVPPNASPFFVFGVYRGSSLKRLRSVASGCPVTFVVTAGETYELAVSTDPDNASKVAASLTLTRRPRNDDFSRAIFLLEAIRARSAGSNAGATSESGEPANALDPAGKSVWWCWGALLATDATINLAGSDFPFPVSVYSGRKLNELQLVAQDYGSVSFHAEPNKLYHIAVGAYNANTGRIVIKLSRASAARSGGR